MLFTETGGVTVSTRSNPPVPTPPDVTVVVACYNDAANLPRAVRSVLTQSMRAVEVIISDDCSTDNTEEVAQELVQSDPRVRYIRQPFNSGGAGAPRNEGVTQARAPFVLFLDSDDELERHACDNLLRMALEQDCDVVAGKCRRYHLNTKTWTTWYPKLYQDRRVIAGAEEEPEFLFDSNSTAKLYRRSFLNRHGISFPEGVKYEDLQFTAKVYALVERLGVIPETVYHWRIYPVRVRRSITQQRNTPENLADRIRAIRYAREFFVEHDKSALVEGLDVKFLAHDARITIEDAANAKDPELGKLLLEMIAPDLKAVPRNFYARLPAMERVAFGMALLRNRAGMQEAKMWRRNQGSLAGRLVPYNGRLLWAPWSAWVPPKPNSLEEFLIDLKHDPIRGTPVQLLRMAHIIYSAEQLPEGGIRIKGTTHDPLLKFTGGEVPPVMNLQVRKRGGTETQSNRIHNILMRPGHIYWTVDVAPFSERDNKHHTHWWLNIKMECEGLENLSGLCLDRQVGDVSFPERHGLVRHLRSRIRLYPTRNGDAAFKRAGIRGRAAKPANVLHWVDVVRERIVKQFRHPSLGFRMTAYQWARRRPVFENLILFDSHMGKQYSDNPRAVYEELLRRDTELEAVWDFLDPSAHPEYSGRRIQRHTLAYSKVVARAAFIVDNQGLPVWASKRSNQFHLQTWHGTPLKRMALHKLENLYASPEARARIARDAAWDALVSPSEYFERTFVDSYLYRGPLLRGGTPRNDVLINNPEPNPGFLRSLDLPAGKQVVLYAPTFREQLRNNRRPADVLLDLDAWVKEMGETHYMLIRSHYLNRFDIRKEHAPYLMDVSHVEEISDLYRVADVMVTDYSSVMFDYIWLDKPIVIYAPDYLDYTRDTRGVYFDLKDDAPGPFCETQSELQGLVQKSNEDPARQAQVRNTFRDRYCGTEDGKAAQRVVDHLLESRKDRQ